MIGNCEIVLKLVRLALGWDNDYTLSEDIDWESVISIAQDQGVAAIIFDGYEEFLRHNPGKTSFMIRPENKDLRSVVFGHITSTERRYKKHLEAFSILSDTLAKDHIPFLLMKGFDCARYYPIPEHRTCGDIDIFPGHLFNESNQVLKEAGFHVDPYYYRHSSSSICGVMVENHRILCDLRGPKRQTNDFEAQLRVLAEDSIANGESVTLNEKSFPIAKFPSADFNALFLPWHVSAHFEFERFTIRHLLDWALFLYHKGYDIDLEMFHDAKLKYTFGFKCFADLLTNLSIRYLNLPEKSVPSAILKDATDFDKRFADRVFDYMFTGNPRERDKNVWKFRMNNIRRIWTDRWKYRKLYGMNVLRFYAYKISGVMFRKGE